jgi:hypothetical protein
MADKASAPGLKPFFSGCLGLRQLSTLTTKTALRTPPGRSQGIVDVDPFLVSNSVRRSSPPAGPDDRGRTGSGPVIPALDRASSSRAGS